MSEERAKRKLSAILSADVKGYSRLMQDDELSTIQTLKGYRELMTSLVLEYRGRVVDSPGDNVLAEFASVVDAVECAVKVQQNLKEKNAELLVNRRMEFRIGVNLGDVIEDEDRIYGDGVNIAARLESLADSGGICISRNAYDQVKSKLDVEFDYLGEKELKNIAEPVRAYRVHIEASTTEPKMSAKLELSDKPSIAVLPFNNISADPEQNYFADGISEDITTELSRFHSLFVISRNSAFIYRGNAVNVKQVGKELGAKYIVEGSVRKSGNRVRVTAQLIAAATGHHVWAERYDRNLEDIFSIQDEITEIIVSTLAGRIEATGIERAKRKNTENMVAYYYLL